MKQYLKMRIRAIILFALLSVGTSAICQTVTGPLTVAKNTMQHYTYNDGSIIQNPAWTLATQTLSGAGSSGTTFFVDVTFIQAGAALLKFSGQDGAIYTFSITVVDCAATTITAPTVTNGSRCLTGTVTLSASTPATGYGIKWYNAAGTAVQGTGVNFTTPGISATTVYSACVYNTTTLCESAKVAVTATVVTPSVSVPPSSVCSGTSASLVLTSSASTVSTWTVAQSSNVSGATAGSGTSSGSGSTYAYTIGQVLSATGAANGTATYTITPSIGSCSGSVVIAVATVKPRPVVTITPQSVFTGFATSIPITSSVSGTTFAYTATPSGAAITGSTAGTVTPIAQLLTNSGTTTGTVTYAVTPTAASCIGSVVSVVATVYPVPVITTSNNVIVMGGNVVISAVSGYLTYAWTNALNVSKGSAQTLNINVPDYDKVTVTMTGVVGSSTSLPLKTVSQMAGQNYNYIISNTVLTATSDTSRIKLFSVDSLSQTIQYVDGLGKPVQTVVTQGSPGKMDIVTPNVYDAFSREYRKYLPFVAQNNGLYKPNVIDASGTYTGAAAGFYSNGLTDKVADDSKVFAETIYEPSPLNRPLKQGAPGLTWQPVSPGGNLYATTDHTSKHRYQNNNNNEVLKFIFSASTGTVTVKTTSTFNYYPAGQLVLNKTLDENNYEILEYTDKDNHMVCKKVQYSTLAGVKQYACTYYVYDDFGNLVAVLPPEAVKMILTAN